MKISVVIPNYKGRDFLPAALDSLLAQTRMPDEIIVVDDATPTADSPVEMIRATYPQVRLLVQPVNKGFAATCNVGIDAAGDADAIALFNNDAEAAPDWLAELERAAVAQPDYAMFASKIVLRDRPNVFHSAGDGFRPTGIPFNRGVWQLDTGQYDAQEEVFGACAAAALYRVRLLDALRADNPDGRVFDEGLGMYYEDVDLNVRARLRGERCLYVPSAYVRHRLSATGGGQRGSYLNGRNCITVAARDLPASMWRKHWPGFAKYQLGRAAESVRHIREPTARATLRGQFAGLRALPRTLQRRKAIQAVRTVGLDELEQLMRA